MCPRSPGRTANTVDKYKISNSNPSRCGGGDWIVIDLQAISLGWQRLKVVPRFHSPWNVGRFSSSSAKAAKGLVPVDCHESYHINLLRYLRYRATSAFKYFEASSPFANQEEFSGVTGNMCSSVLIKNKCSQILCHETEPPRRNFEL